MLSAQQQTNDGPDMLSLRSLLMTAVLLAMLNAPSAAQEPAYYDSLRLVSAMREDELMLLAARAAKLQRGELSAGDAECLDRFEIRRSRISLRGTSRRT
jgi:hypothetical protein